MGEMRFNFDRFYGGEQMAEGVAVHAENIESAEKKASKLLVGNGDRLVFAGISKCISQCHICGV